MASNLKPLPNQDPALAAEVNNYLSSFMQALRMANVTVTKSDKKAKKELKRTK